MDNNRGDEKVVCPQCERTVPDFGTVPILADNKTVPYCVLPPGIYPCSEKEFRKRFVKRFPVTSERDKIYSCFSLFRREAVRHGLALTGWINGSFVSTDNDPS